MVRETARFGIVLLLSALAATCSDGRHVRDDPDGEPAADGDADADADVDGDADSDADDDVDSDVDIDSDTDVDGDADADADADAEVDADLDGGPSCVDADGDGFGVGPGCEPEDCDDADPTVHPGAEEVCNGLDDDCDGAVDDVPGLGTACDTGEPGVCAAGTLRCRGRDLVCRAETTPSREACANGLDDDCDGAADCEDVEDCLGELCDRAAFPPPLCQADGSCAVADFEDCTNGSDDDGDGFVDCHDILDCPPGETCSASGSGAECVIDTAVTPRCAETACLLSSGDEDGDGLANCADPDCEGERCGITRTCRDGSCEW